MPAAVSALYLMNQSIFLSDWIVPYERADGRSGVRPFGYFWGNTCLSKLGWSSSISDALWTVILYRSPVRVYGRSGSVVIFRRVFFEDSHLSLPSPYDSYCLAFPPFFLEAIVFSGNSSGHRRFQTHYGRWSFFRCGVRVYGRSPVRLLVFWVVFPAYWQLKA